MFSLSHPVFQKGTTVPKLRNVNLINASPESVRELEVDVSQEAAVIQMVDGASKQTLESLRQRLEEVSLS
jgi:hypothetical protein